jgi:hypothetical protein
MWIRRRHHPPDLAIGNGMYKSTDAGRTWQHLGLRDSQMIAGDRRRSGQCRSAVRRGARPSVRSESRARRLSFD